VSAVILEEMVGVYRVLESLFFLWELGVWWLYSFIVIYVIPFLRGRSCGISLDKVPSRVALCLDVKFTRPGIACLRALENMSRVALWCFDAGVADVTVYESSGVLMCGLHLVGQGLSSLLRDEKYMQRLLFGNAQDIKRVDIFRGGEIDPLYSVSGICSSGRSVSIRFLSAEDSEEDFARVTQELVDDSEVQTEKITEDLLSSRFSSSRGNSDKVDLILTYSSSPNLLGFPPWLMRTPEIL